MRMMLINYASQTVTCNTPAAWGDTVNSKEPGDPYLDNDEPRTSQHEELLRWSRQQFAGHSSCGQERSWQGVPDATHRFINAPAATIILIGVGNIAVGLASHRALRSPT